MRAFSIVILIVLIQTIFNSSGIVGFGYWVLGDHMKDVDLKDLSKKGTTDIFIKSNAFDEHGEKEVLSWVEKANDYNIRIHIWMKVFNRDGKWLDPAEIDYDYIIEEAKAYASKPGISGVNLDYIRYHSGHYAYETDGGAEAISNFVKQAAKEIHSINSDCIVSAAIIPETTNSLKYYGQDYSVFSKYLDLVLPMIYRGNYKEDTDWILSTSEWYVKNSKGASVWIGLLSYKSDDDLTELSSSELNKDIKAALKPKSDGVILYRWGLSYNVDFNSF